MFHLCSFFLRGPNTEGIKYKCGISSVTNTFARDGVGVFWSGVNFSHLNALSSVLVYRCFRGAEMRAELWLDFNLAWLVAEVFSTWGLQSSCRQHPRDGPLGPCL